MPNIEKAAKLLEASNIPFLRNEPLKNHTTFRIGGPAALLCTPSNTEQIAKIYEHAQNCELPIYILGKGSNIIFDDAGYNGIIVHIGDILAEISVDGDAVIAGAGASYEDTCMFAHTSGLAGLEFAYGIPGSVGGAAYMNAGAYGGETKDVLHSVTCVESDGKLVNLPASELKLGYRTSVFQEKECCIVQARFALQKGDKSEILAKMQDNMRRRKEKQPLDMPSAGSTFKRPPGAFAGTLIDQCGLRGFRYNDAAISQKHCGFVVNLGNATAADVLALTTEVSRIVKEKTGFVLEKEIRVVRTP